MYMTKTLNQIIFFFLHQHQNIFFSNIGNQNIFLEKNHNPPPPPPPFQVKWSFPNKKLREVKYEIAGPLCLLFNKSLRDKIFPADWKLAHIIPIFKSGDKSSMSNYRPVALLLYLVL